MSGEWPLCYCSVAIERGMCTFDDVDMVVH